MAHHLTGLIAAPQVLQTFARRHRLHQPVALTPALALLPLRDDDIDSFIPAPQSFDIDGFTYLSRQLLDVIRDASRAGPVAYVETGYFGGTGGQGAVLCRDGAVLFGPAWGDGKPINQALALLGIATVPPAIDEFETVGLQRHRDTAGWLGGTDDDD